MKNLWNAVVSTLFTQYFYIFNFGNSRNAYIFKYNMLNWMEGFSFAYEICFYCQLNLKISIINYFQNSVPNKNKIGN